MMAQMCSSSIVLPVPSSPCVCQEGPHSTMNEEEFFDALEMAYQEDELDPVSVYYSR